MTNYKHITREMSMAQIDLPKETDEDENINNIPSHRFKLRHVLIVTQTKKQPIESQHIFKNYTSLPL